MAARGLSDEQITDLLRVDDPLEGRASLRAKLLVALLGLEGYGLDEAARLQGIDYRDGLLRGQEISEQTGRVLGRMLQIAEHRHLLAHGRDRPPSARALSEVLAHHATRVGVTLNAARLKRTYARRAWEAGMSRNDLARRLGYDDVASLRRLIRSELGA